MNHIIIYRIQFCTYLQKKEKFRQFNRMEICFSVLSLKIAFRLENAVRIRICNCFEHWSICPFFNGFNGSSHSMFFCWSLFSINRLSKRHCTWLAELSVDTTSKVKKKKITVYFCRIVQDYTDAKQLSEKKKKKMYFSDHKSFL